MCYQICAALLCLLCAAPPVLAQRQPPDSLTNFPELEVGCGEAEQFGGQAIERATGVPVTNLIIPRVTARTPLRAQRSPRPTKWSTPATTGRSSRAVSLTGTSKTLRTWPLSTTGRVRDAIAQVEEREEESVETSLEPQTSAHSAYPYPPTQVPEVGAVPFGEPEAAHLSTALPAWFVWEQSLQPQTAQRRAYVPGAGPRSGSTLPLPASTVSPGDQVPVRSQFAPRSGALRYLSRGRRCGI